MLSKLHLHGAMIASCATVCSTANAWSTTFACATISPVTVASGYAMQEVGVTSFAASRLHVLVWLHGCSWQFCMSHCQLLLHCGCFDAGGAVLEYDAAAYAAAVIAAADATTNAWSNAVAWNVVLIVTMQEDAAVFHHRPS